MSKILALLLVASIAFAGCVQQASPPPAVQPPQITTATATIQPTSTATSTASASVAATPSATQTPEKEFELTARQWEFQPSTITVNKGDKVKLKIKSVDVEHGFSLPDFTVSADLKPSQEAVVEFTADKAGTFSFFCNVFCGSGHSGMSGTLVVQE